MDFSNVYEDITRAAAYADLEFPGTYYLAYRDLPDIITRHVNGRAAIDFGCGAGRSARFLQKLGFTTIGVDISADMISQARRRDPHGDYRLIEDGTSGELPAGAYDLVLSVFTFDNIPTKAKKVAIFRAMRRLLNENGCIISLVSSPDIYTHEWASFSTKDFPHNKTAQDGDIVHTIMTDVVDQRPVTDILWTDAAYRQVYRRAGLKVVQTYRPLAYAHEPYPWVNETTIPPWAIYVLQK
jgi:SAM-dependent methyltransferase